MGYEKPNERSNLPVESIFSRLEELIRCSFAISPPPGLLDFSTAQHLGIVTFPGKFTITEAGQTVVEAQTASLTRPTNADPSIYSSAGLNALGADFLLTPPWRMQDIDFEDIRDNKASNGQFVVVRGMVAPDGSVTEADVVASSNPMRMAPQDGQNGATTQSHEAFFITLFPTN